MGKQKGCQGPEGKEVQAWDSAGQPAAEMAKGSSKAERPNRTAVFIVLPIAVASAMKAGEMEL